MKKIVKLFPLLLAALSLSACSFANVSKQETNNKQLLNVYNINLPTLGGNDPISYVDWLDSLKGEKGTDGVAPTITIGNNGNFFINGVDTHFSAKGQKGEKGQTGDDAVTPYELYKSLHPDYDKSENGFYLDLANGRAGEQICHDVKFVINNNDMLTLQVVHGEKVNKPDFTALQGVTIAYWTYQNEAWNFNASVTEDMTLVAVLE